MELLCVLNRVYYSPKNSHDLQLTVGKQNRRAHFQKVHHHTTQSVGLVGNQNFLSTSFSSHAYCYVVLGICMQATITALLSIHIHGFGYYMQENKLSWQTKPLTPIINNNNNRYEMYGRKLPTVSTPEIVICF